MKDVNLIVAPFQFLSFLECDIHKCVNEHVTAHVSGYIADQDTDELVLRCGEKEQVSIYAKDESGARECLFRGMVKQISISEVNGLKKLTLDAISYSSQLERREWIRTFQNRKQSYRDVAEYISSKNSNSLFIYTMGSQKIGRMVVQYKETDWDFLKRLAAMQNTVIVPDYKNGNCCICYGIPRKSGEEDLHSISYTVSKRMEAYELLKKKGVGGIREQDALEYAVESRDILELCGKVRFQGLPLLIHRIDTRLVGNELIHTYYLRPEGGFKQAFYHNEKIIGTSITGNVTKVKNDLVKVSIDSDNDREERWFYYATVYSNPEGTGWYCMPEIDDKIRVYFPDGEEDNAYVISAVHLGVVNDLRTKPDEKSIRTIFDKEIRLTPTKILITNHNGLSITLDDKKGISVVSNKTITMTAQQTEIISGSNIDISAQGGISLHQNANAVAIGEGGVRIYGVDVIYR